MIPCRLTGKPFWDVYLYRDPPLWQAYISCCKQFGFDGWLPDCFNQALFPPVQNPDMKIVSRTEECIITRLRTQAKGRVWWSDWGHVYSQHIPGR